MIDIITSINAAIANNHPGVEIILPPGVTTFDNTIILDYPTTPFRITMRGCGCDTTTVVFSNTDGFVCNMSIPQHTIHMSDMTLATPLNGTTTAITCNQDTPQGMFSQNEFERLKFIGTDPLNLTNYWANQIVLNGLGNVNFYGILGYGQPIGVTAAHGNGVVINGLKSGNNPFGIVYNFTDCSFWEMAAGIVYGTNVQGVTVKGVNFTNVVNGIFQPFGAIAGAQLAVSDSQFNCFGNGILLFGHLDNLQLFNNLFLVVPENAAAIGLGGSGAEYTIIGNVFSTIGVPTAGTNAINFAVSSPTYQIGTINGNTFEGFITAVNLTGAKRFNVQGNVYENCANQVWNPNGSINSVGVVTK